MKMDNRLKSGWNLPIEGMPIALVPFHENILALTVPNKKSKKYQLEGWLIEPGSGKLLKRKVIFLIDEDDLVDIKVLVNPVSKDFRLGLRYFKEKIGVGTRDFGAWARERMISFSTSNNIELLAFDNQMEQTSKLNIPLQETGAFIGCDLNANNELLFAHFTEDNQVVVQSHNIQNGSLLKKMSFSLDVKKKTEILPDLIESKKNPYIV